MKPLIIKVIIDYASFRRTLFSVCDSKYFNHAGFIAVKI